MIMINNNSINNREVEEYLKELKQEVKSDLMKEFPHLREQAARLFNKQVNLSSDSII